MKVRHVPPIRPGVACTDAKSGGVLKQRRIQMVIDWPSNSYLLPPELLKMSHRPWSLVGMIARPNTKDDCVLFVVGHYCVANMHSTCFFFSRNFASKRHPGSEVVKRPTTFAVASSSQASAKCQNIRRCACHCQVHLKSRRRPPIIISAPCCSWAGP
jgi:hypothetical protein